MMGPKFNAVVGILLLLSFVGAFATGYFKWQMQLHEPFALAMLVLVIIHLMAYGKMMKLAFKSSGVKGKR
jgi:hypothetical protein